jgi:hypothetical protein
VGGLPPFGIIAIPVKVTASQQPIIKVRKTDTKPLAEQNEEETEQ